ncbi:MAG: hypothetical protein ACKOQM_10480 [Novosphingobium sp.]
MFKSAQLAISLILLWLPFVLSVILSDDSNAGLILMLPFFFTIPALIVAFLIFTPLERFLKRRGADSQSIILVPLSGMLSVVAFKLFVSAPYLFSNKPGVENIPAASWSGMSFMILGGLAWGIVWLLSGGILRWLGLKEA